MCDLSEVVYLLDAPSLKVLAKHFKLEANAVKDHICRQLIRLALQKDVFGLTMERKVLKKYKLSDTKALHK